MYDSTHNLGKRLLVCSVPWNLWNFMEVCQVIFNLTILQSHTFSFRNFSQTMVYYVVNVPRHQEPQKHDMVWELTTFNLTWCDKTKSVVIL